MKKRFRRIFKLNLMSLFLIAVSFISVTLAWFAYSGIANANLEVNVKAWYIDLEQDGEKISNDIIISLDEIYPGMEPVNELVKIQNLGDSDAEIKYSILSARVLGEYQKDYEIEEFDSEEVEDILAHDFPFNINISVTRHYALAKGDESLFEVSVSWPLDSGNDNLDSLWGNKAYEFQRNEENNKKFNNEYQIRPAIKVVISLTAEQYLGGNNSPDPKYNLGDEIRFDVANNQRCSTINSTCLITYVLDVNNTLGDNTVTLLPNPLSSYLSVGYNNYENAFNSISSTWNVLNKRPLQINDIMPIISNDVSRSYLIGDNISGSIIGKLNYNDRIYTEVAKAIPLNGYYIFHNERFSFLSASECYWIDYEYGIDKAFALQKIDEDTSKVFGQSKTSNCKVIPVIEVLKADLE